MCEQVTYCTVLLRNRLFNSEEKFMHKGRNVALICTFHAVNKINVQPKGIAYPEGRDKSTRNRKPDCFKELQ